MQPATLIETFERELSKVATHLYPDDMPLSSAAKYALLSGGKRIRPLITLQACEAAGADAMRAMPAAVAVEMIHTYSLIHDDLPCMDNDDLRRGKPTVHKAFSEDIALLAGDALLTDAFTVLTSDEIAAVLGAEALSPAIRMLQVQHLARAAGGGGMVMGQALDLYWTARSGAKKSDLDSIHINKTGKLLGAAAALGAAASGTGSDIVNKFSKFGELTGLAFQIRDDLLDTQVGTGKSVGKDAQAGKLTYATTMPGSESEAAAEHYTGQALACLESTGLDTSALGLTAQKLLSRTK